MSLKTVSWALLASIAVGAVLLFNHWASFQPLSTLVYTGIVLALCGLANVVIPFRFLGIRKRAIGAALFVVGVAIAFTAILWPAPIVRIAQHKILLDDLMPEYQFSERHSVCIHARPEQVMQAVREATWGDLKSLATLMKIRSAVSRTAIQDGGYFSKDKRILDAFSASGYVRGGSEHEIVMYGGANARAGRPLRPNNLQEFADYKEQGAVKMAFDFNVEGSGDWSTVTAETRVVATDDMTRRGMGRYWRLIVPGSGLLRRQWLDGIKKRAESTGNLKPQYSAN